MRTTPVPDVPGIDQTLAGTELDAQRRVVNRRSQDFFVRNLVLTADGVLLNPAAPESPFVTFLTEGHMPYAEVGTGSFNDMLDRALVRHRERTRVESLATARVVGSERCCDQD